MAEDIAAAEGSGMGGKVAGFLAKIDGLTKIQRLLICIGTVLLIGGVWYYFFFMPANKQLQTAKKTHKQKLEKLTSFKRQAMALESYEKQMAAVQEEFNIAMKALPDSKELPSLLTGISTAGNNTGLVFLLFEPNPVVSKDFYKEIPLSMRVEGDYHQIADFVHQVAALNRIVNIKDLSMEVDKTRSDIIQMQCRAVTYMFSEPEPEPEQTKKGKKRSKSKKKG